MRKTRIASDENPAIEAPNEQLPVGWIAVKTFRVTFQKDVATKKEFAFDDLHFSTITEMITWLKRRIV